MSHAPRCRLDARGKRLACSRLLSRFIVARKLSESAAAPDSMYIGEVWVISGASRGIGAELAEQVSCVCSDTPLQNTIGLNERASEPMQLSRCCKQQVAQLSPQDEQLRRQSVLESCARGSLVGCTSFL